jgi:hypothetical protein
VLGVYGERDLLVPGPRSKAIIDSLAPMAHGPWEAVLIPEAGHQLRPGRITSWSPEYWNAEKAGCDGSGCCTKVCP